MAMQLPYSQILSQFGYLQINKHQHIYRHPDGHEIRASQGSAGGWMWATNYSGQTGRAASTLSKYLSKCQGLREMQEVSYGPTPLG
jgi:hypothetical protein